MEVYDGMMELQYLPFVYGGGDGAVESKGRLYQSYEEHIRFVTNNL